ncbi:MAG: tetratricopeptide repeat protein, partial [Pedosphaera parvula]|nr:tetratricopeptide repeat protein [Pedosphaera parvula]
PAAWNNLANHYGHNGPATNAFVCYAKAIELAPRESVYYENFATTVYLFRRDATNFFGISEEAVFDKAMALYRKALHTDPNDADANAELGLLLVASGREHDAEPFLLTALDRDAENHRALSALGLIALSRESIDEAIARFVSALEIDLDNAPILARLLDCAASAGKYDVALPMTRRFVDFYPGNVEIALRFAEALHAAGETREAIERLDTLLLLQPGHHAATALLARFRETSS